MKKLISLLLALVMTATMTAVCVSAEDGEEEPTLVEDILALAYDAAGENANKAYQKDGNGGMTALGLKPLDTTTPEGAWFEYKYNVPADCVKINIVLSYAASGNRYCDLTFNGETKNVVCDSTGDWGTFFMTSTTFEKVSKGDYVIRVAAPSDFNDSTIKTPNIDLISVELFYESYESLPETEPETVPETEPETTPAPVTTATDPEVTTAPAAEKTSGCGSTLGASALIVTVTAIFGCAVIKKK